MDVTGRINLSKSGEGVFHFKAAAPTDDGLIEILLGSPDASEMQDYRRGPDKNAVRNLCFSQSRAGTC